MHITTQLYAVFVVVFVIINCDRAKAYSRRQGSREENTQFLINEGRTILELSSDAQLQEYLTKLPKCLAKSDATIRSLIGPTMATLKTIFFIWRRELHDDQNLKRSALLFEEGDEFFKRDRAADIGTVLGLAKQLLTKFTDDELLTAVKIKKATGSSPGFLSSKANDIVLMALDTCANAQDSKRYLNLYEEFQNDDE